MPGRRIYYILSVGIAVLMAAASVLGLLWRESIYPTEELIRAFLPNDLVVLLIGLPMLLISTGLARRGSLGGLLLWPGALLFAGYNYIIYLLAMSFNLLYILALVQVTLILYTLSGLLAGIDGEEVRKRLAGHVPERPAGGILIALGALFLLRALGMLIIAQISHESMPGTELALLSTDLLFTPAWIVGGILLWRRKAFAYVCALGLLFQASMLFIGLIIVLALQPLMTGAPFPLVDIVVVFVMGLVCFIPFTLFIIALWKLPE